MSDQSYFRSSGYSADLIIQAKSGKTLDMGTLPAFLRTLMVMDGTVTKALSAWYWEPIKVESVSNILITSTESIEDLNIRVGDQILQREVILQGGNTKQPYACARSIVSLKNLPDETANQLSKGEIGIGELLRENGIETYRDIFDINYYPKIDLQDALLNHLTGELVSRSYRIRVNGTPAMIVSEYFPLTN